MPLSSYTVTFVGHDSKTLKTETVERGAAAPAPEAPAIEGYTFLGWDKPLNNITENTTITARWLKTPEITRQPQNQIMLEGTNATLRVLANTGTVGTVSYQWQTAAPNSNEWTNVTTGVSGNTTNYRTPALANNETGRQYRVIITNTYNGIETRTTSAEVTITIQENLYTLSAPSLVLRDQIVAHDQDLQLTLNASGSIFRTNGVQQPADITYTYTIDPAGSDVGFRSEETINRLEAMVVLARAARFLDLADNGEGAAKLNNYIDHSEVALWARGDVALVVGLEIFNGFGNNDLKPKESISRSQSAQAITNLLTISQLINR